MSDDSRRTFRLSFTTGELEELVGKPRTYETPAPVITAVEDGFMVDYGSGFSFFLQARFFEPLVKAADETVARYERDRP